VLGRVTRVVVGVVGTRQLAIGLLDLVGRGVLADAELLDIAGRLGGPREEEGVAWGWEEHKAVERRAGRECR